jgi:hypothetical protein
MLIAVALTTSFSLSCEKCVVNSASAYPDTGDVLDVAREELGKAVWAVRAAEAAGAGQDELEVLVRRLNLAVEMIERSERLLGRGELDQATAQLQRSVEVSREVTSKATQLREEAERLAYHARLISFGMIPIASLLVTAANHFSWRWLKRRETERIMRMEIRKGKETREERE